jgi:hypothetical protein
MMTATANENDRFAVGTGLHEHGERARWEAWCPIRWRLEQVE